MPKPKKYTPQALEKAIEAYFSSITRTEHVYEETPDGELIPAMTDKGDPVTRIKYLTPPLEGELCQYLGISAMTWCAYRDDPEYSAVVQSAKQRCKNYLERELLTREGKNTRGVEFALSANYGMAPAAKRELDLGPTAAQVASRMVPLEERADLLKEIAKRFGGDGE